MEQCAPNHNREAVYRCAAEAHPGYIGKVKCMQVPAYRQIT